MSQAATSPSLPERMGRYEIRRELGRGAMGVVYEAQDPALGRTVALKTINPFFALHPGDREAFEARFFAEAASAGRLAHPGIVVVYDAARDPDTGALFMALEYLEGKTLAEMVAGGLALCWCEALRITACIADALHHAHSQGIVHRDIKPSNVMILRSGEPKIMDFGIARAMTSRIRITVAGQFLGTPLYMSPEQALGRNVDARGDLFSLGSVAYTLLTGRNAFAAPTLTKITSRVIHDQPPAPSQFVLGLPAEVDRVLARALAKDPTERYPDGAALARALEEILARRAPADGVARPHEVSTVVPPEGDVLDGLDDYVGGDAGLPALDIEAELHTLVSGPASPGVPDAPDATSPLGVPPGRATSSVSAFAELLARSWHAAALLGLLAIAAILFLKRPGEEPAAMASPMPNVVPAVAPAPVLRRPANQPAPAAPQVEPSPVVAESVAEARSYAAPEGGPRARRSPPARRSLADPTPSPTTVSKRDGQGTAAASRPPVPSSPAPVPAATAPARATHAPAALLSLDFEHALKDGVLRVWVDGTLVLREELEGQVTRKLIAITLRKGELREVLKVSPGSHRLTVDVEWKDGQRTSRIEGNFEAGSTRSLRVRLSRLAKDLSLAWI